jgi:hypothetical protein
MIAQHKCFLTTYLFIAPFVEVDCKFARNKIKKKYPSNISEIVQMASLLRTATAAADEVGFEIFLTWLLVFDLTCLCKTGRNVPFLFHIPTSAIFTPPAKLRVLCEALTPTYSSILFHISREALHNPVIGGFRKKGHLLVCCRNAYPFLTFKIIVSEFT